MGTPTPPAPPTPPGNDPDRWLRIALVAMVPTGLGLFAAGVIGTPEFAGLLTAVGSMFTVLGRSPK